MPQKHRSASALESSEVVHDSDDDYRVQRETREAAVDVRLRFGDRREPRLETTLAFFNHMLEMVCWHGGFTADVSFEVKTYRLTHVVCEDVGLALGRVFREAVKERVAEGVESIGESHGMIDEALAFSMVSFEGRAGSHVSRGGASANEHVEDMLAADLVAFFEGFAQGAHATVRVDVLEADDPHHAWEAAFRAFGRSLRFALVPNSWRAGMTAGVKGTLD